jgi:hypothetical protein
MARKMLSQYTNLTTDGSQYMLSEFTNLTTDGAAWCFLTWGSLDKSPPEVVFLRRVRLQR